MKILEKFLDYDTEKLSYHIDSVNVITYPCSQLNTGFI